MRVFTPRVTDMRNGRWRPEIIISGAKDEVVFLELAPDIDAAWERACDVIELVPGDWTDSGRWYVVP
jgi:hypothetical protein